MANRIGYIEKNGVKYISVSDVFSYLSEQGAFDGNKEYAYRWNFEQAITKLMYDAYKSGERAGSEVPFIIEGAFFCHWTRFTYDALSKAIKSVKNETELKKVAYAIDLTETIGKNKMFLKRTYALR